MKFLHLARYRRTPSLALLLVLAVLARAILPQGVMVSYDAHHGAHVTPCPGHVAMAESVRHDPADPAPDDSPASGSSICPFASAGAPALPAFDAHHAVACTTDARLTLSSACAGPCIADGACTPPPSRAPPAAWAA
jgi:hypothetical protein